jgi:hypothetical protein
VKGKNDDYYAFISGHVLDTARFDEPWHLVFPYSSDKPALARVEKKMRLVFTYPPNIPSGNLQTQLPFLIGDDLVICCQKVETYDLCVAENLARSEAGVRAGSDPPKNDARVNLGATVKSKGRYFVLTAAHVLDSTNFDERWLLKYQYGTAEAAVARRVALPASSSTHDLATDIGIPKIEKTSEHLVHPTLPHIHREGYGLDYLVPGIYNRLAANLGIRTWRAARISSKLQRGDNIWVYKDGVAWHLKFRWGTEEPAIAHRVALPTSSSTDDMATEVGILKIEKTSEHLIEPRIPRLHMETYGLRAPH